MYLKILNRDPASSLTQFHLLYPLLDPNMLQVPLQKVLIQQSDSVSQGVYKRKLSQHQLVALASRLAGSSTSLTDITYASSALKKRKNIWAATWIFELIGQVKSMRLVFIESVLKNETNLIASKAGKKMDTKTTKKKIANDHVFNNYIHRHHLSISSPKHHQLAVWLSTNITH